VVLHVYELPPFEDAMLSGAMINGVINLDPRMLDGWMDTVKLAVRQKIESVLTPLGAAYTYREERGRTAPVVAQVAKEIEANLIVVGSRGKGMVESFLLGSVSDRVAQIATCSVLIVR
jgi:nucleotide-binding universal stress UspA family protein